MYPNEECFEQMLWQLSYVYHSEQEWFPWSWFETYYYDDDDDYKSREKDNTD
jgi:hypothetical protein